MEKLKAINIALQALGEYPVNALDSGLPLAGIAQDKVEELTAEQQRSGWWFNREELTLDPNTDNEIVLPVDIVRVEPTYHRLTVRDDKLFDMEKSSYKMDSSVRVLAIRNLPWDDLPDSFQKFIAKEAGVELQRAYLGSRLLDQFTRDERTQAWQSLRAEELEMSRFNTNTGTLDMVKTTVRRSPW